MYTKIEPNSVIITILPRQEYNKYARIVEAVNKEGEKVFRVVYGDKSDDKYFYESSTKKEAQDCMNRTIAQEIHELEKVQDNYTKRIAYYHIVPQTISINIEKVDKESFNITIISNKTCEDFWLSSVAQVKRFLQMWQEQKYPLFEDKDFVFHYDYFICNEMIHDIFTSKSFNSKIFEILDDIDFMFCENVITSYK